MEFINPRGIRFQRNEETASTVGSKPYGLSCLNKLFGFLCSLIQPKPSNTVSIRQLGLSLIDTILEIQCPPFPAHLLPLVRNDLCKNLCLNLLSEELSIFTLTLGIWYNLFGHQSYKEALKLQMEAFLLCMLNTVMDSRYSSYEKQEVALEKLLEFCSSPSFLVELYLNFDCDIYCANLFESLCKFLYKNAFPVSGSLYALHVLSLDVLLAAIQAISERCKNPPPIPGYVLLQKSYRRENSLNEHWNKDYKVGLKFLQEYLLPDPSDAPSVAAFLRNTLGLDKTIIGQYLGKEHDFNKAVLQAYLNTFNFQGVSLLPALRTFLETFRLHGETGQITRILILENFSSRYYECNPMTFADEDLCYLLTFSVVLLNSDLHNASVPVFISS
ncbi:Golgi brefeldin A resistant guanine nucleotide exchange factor 1 [Balamuthia mandrillaris]